MIPSARRWQALVILPKLQLVQATQLLVTLVALPASAPLGVYCGGKVDWQLVDLGGHRMSGPPSVAGTFWTAAAMNVPTSPTIRSIVLIALFMGSSPISAGEIR